MNFDGLMPKARGSERERERGWEHSERSFNVTAIFCCRSSKLRRDRTRATIGAQAGSDSGKRAGARRMHHRRGLSAPQVAEVAVEAKGAMCEARAGRAGQTRGSFQGFNCVSKCRINGLPGN